MIDVIIPTKGHQHLERCLASVRDHLKFKHKVHLITDGDSWASAVNLGFEESKHDVVIMDDDIELLAGFLKNIDRYKSSADIIGFKLLFPNGRIQHAGGILIYSIMDRLKGRNPFRVTHRGYAQIDIGQYENPKYLVHVTTSLVYIRRYVLDELRMDEDFPGFQFEDVDFSFQALMKGFRILYIPQQAIHHESLTKKRDKKFYEKNAANFEYISHKWFARKDFMRLLRKRKFITWRFSSLQVNSSGGNSMRLL